MKIEKYNDNYKITLQSSEWQGLSLNGQLSLLKLTSFGRNLIGAVENSLTKFNFEPEKSPWFSTFFKMKMVSL